MRKLVLTPELRAKLNGLNEKAEILDEQGKTVGHFLPANQYGKLVCALANAQISDKELEAISREPGRRSLREIWTDLGRM